MVEVWISDETQKARVVALASDQQLRPDSDRRNVVELWRVRAEREYAQLCEREAEQERKR